MYLEHGVLLLSSTLNMRGAKIRLDLPSIKIKCVVVGALYVRYVRIVCLRCGNRKIASKCTFPETKPKTYLLRVNCNPRPVVLGTKVWIFVCIEHGMLLFKYGLETLIHDTPTDVTIQLKRNDFLVSKVSWYDVSMHATIEVRALYSEFFFEYDEAP